MDENAQQNKQALLQEAKTLIEEQRFLEARQQLLPLLEAGAETEKPPELWKEDELDALRLMAEALGAQGEPEEGVRYLEQRYERAKTDEERKEAMTLLYGYRARFNLGKLWQFVNEAGEPLFESADVEEIRNRLLDGVIPRTAQCRKNRVGEPLAIKDSLVKEEARIEILFSPIGYHVIRGAGITAVLTVIASLFMGFYTLGSELRMGFLQTLAFAVVFLAMLGGLAGSGKSRGAGCVVTIVGGLILVAITGGRINFAFLAGFSCGFPIGLFFSALLGAIPGAILGCLVGLIRWPMLPRLPRLPASS